MMVTMLSKYHYNDVVCFESLDENVKILQCSHDFDLGKAEAVEISKNDWEALSKEINDDNWMDFDLETWGK
jgi:hypothetical protein